MVMIAGKSFLRRFAPMKRIVILDSLRGFALLGIAIANYPEFSLYSFLSDSEQSAMPTADADMLTRWLELVFVDGKFYTIFSVLFGIGFSIILRNCMARGIGGMKVFYRRMAVLAVIGVAHLLLLWSGDILLLYALMGMLLPLWSKCSVKSLLICAVALLALPVICDTLISVTGVDPSEGPYRLWWDTAAAYGITESNFATWLRDADGYADVHAFLMQGAWERMWEFVGSHRYFKVLGLFLIGYAIGKSDMYAHVETHLPFIRRVCWCAMCIGLPLSVAYAWSCVNGHPLGDIAHALLYAMSVYPLGIAYMAGITLVYERCSHWRIWTALAMPGRMSLTCYLMESVVGIMMYYGIGCGLGLGMGLWQVLLVSVVVYVVLMALAAVWLRWMKYGPCEWIWKMLTYGKWMSITERN